MSRPRRTQRMHRREPDHIHVIGRAHISRPVGPLALAAAQILADAALARRDGLCIIGAAVLPYPRLTIREIAHV